MAETMSFNISSAFFSRIFLKNLWSTVFDQLFKKMLQWLESLHMP